MKKCLMLLMTTLLLSTSSLAQQHFSNLDQVGESIENRIRSVMDEWTIHHIQPMSYADTAPSETVKILHCESSARDVRIALQKYSSIENAANDLLRFATGKRATGINGLGDEAYLHGIESAIAFRKGNLLVFISAIADKENDNTVDLRNPTARANAEHNEEAVVTRVFARHVATVLQTL